MGAVAEERITIKGSVGDIEAIWWPSTANSTKTAIICHPHPLYGGTMDNKVVTTLARAWRDLGYSVLRFNFRGVGASQGVHDQGRGEQDDLQAVLQWLQDNHAVNTLDLAGFSFGAWVAAALTSRSQTLWQPAHLLLVAPPVHYEGFQSLQLPTQTLVLQGEEDEVVEPEAVYAWVASRSPAIVLQRFSGASHFFHGRLTELKQAVIAYLS